MEPIGILLVVVAIAVVIRLLAGSMDGDRIETYVRQRGGTLRSKSWAPFGKGWLGEKSDRIYEIEYETSAGEIRRATVKTSMLTGVYFTDDRPVGRDGKSMADLAPTDEAAALRAENARLKAELDRLSDRRN
jgi:hypothetical protein